ncbi:MAG TPA: AraC family transcriptional regulator [Planctomycetota bacterium]|nr:AraC family transcriptional regulator [Planctomycetota bacterium]
MTLSSAELLRRKAFQSSFLRRLGGTQPLRELFDHLPDVAFSLKDASSRVVCANRAVLDKFGMANELEIVGTTDRDRYPARMAEVFIRGDREVVETGRPRIDRLEVWYNAQGALDWCVVTKRPVRDGRGRVVGVMMLMRPWRGSPRQLLPGSGIGRVVRSIRRSPGEHHRVPSLARQAGLSSRQLQRRFLEHFGVGVKEFVMRARLQSAAEALQSGTASIAEVALESGFYDQSSFTRHFRKRIGMTPAGFRRRHVKG